MAIFCITICKSCKERQLYKYLNDYSLFIEITMCNKVKLKMLV